MANVAVRVILAPYADIAIPLFLGSITGTRYRSLNCLECGQEFLERNNDTMYRIGDDSLPAEVAIGSESVKARCGNCQQWYGIQVSPNVSFQAEGIPLYLQPQSIYLSIESSKKLRYLHCLECGKTFQTISDRIGQVVDNRVPFEYVNPGKLGPIEQTCPFNRCGQTWALMV